MPIPIIKIDPKGGTIRAEIKFKTPQAGAYTLWLWEAGSNEILMEERGNNDNPEDDIYSLPMPASKNVGRILECTATLVDPTGKGPYSVDMEVTQDGQTLDVVNSKGNMTNTSVTCTLLAKLG